SEKVRVDDAGSSVSMSGLAVIVLSKVLSEDLPPRSPRSHDAMRQVLNPAPLGALGGSDRGAAPPRRSARGNRAGRRDKSHADAGIRCTSRRKRWARSSIPTARTWRAA